MVSLFVQWVALGGTTALCYARRILNRLPRLRALAGAFLLLLTVTFLVSELAVWLLWMLGKTPSPRPEWYSSFHILTLTLSAIVNGMLLRLFIAKHGLTQRIASEAQAKLQALQSRVRPHFVFNSLNIIASLTRSAGEGRGRARGHGGPVPHDAVAGRDAGAGEKRDRHDQKYLALETLRLDNRLQVEWEVGTLPRKAAIPVLTLQPLIENAIRHGIESLPEGGTVRVRLQELNGRIHIEVTNPRPPVRAPCAQRPRPVARGHPPAPARHYGDAALLPGRDWALHRHGGAADSGGDA